VKKKKPPSKYRKGFGRRLRASRIAAGFATQEAMATRIGIQLAAYGRWERGETEPSLDNLVTISDAVQKSIDFLIRGASP
jgi:transcriptional regulator with XRE-family HTH domain